MTAPSAYMKVLCAPLIAAMMLSVAVGAIAGPLDDVNAAYKRGDFTAALPMLQTLADKGIAEAQYQLGYMHYIGLGVPQDYATAAEWYEAAAQRGFAQAQHDLGVMYLDGQGVPQDYIQAHMWLNLAASQLSDKDGRGAAVQARDFVASKMTAADVAQAQRLAREWKPIGAHPVHSVVQDR